MTLLEILVKELPKWGGWPEGVAVIEQDESGVLYDPYADKGTLFGGVKFDLPDDSSYAFATCEEYVSSLPDEWNGEGLPPVGCVVEVRSEDFEGDWITIKVVYVHNEEVVGVVQSESEHLNDQLEKFSRNYNRAEFRPIRSEAERKRDEAGLALYHAINWNAEGELLSPARMEDYKKAYDAIAAGKIPGIRIE